MATLYAIDSTNDSILASQSFTKSNGLDLAVSPAGDFVYVALQPTTPATAKPQILVMANSDLTTTVNTLSPVGANGDAIRLAVAPAPDARLLAVVPSANNVVIWSAPNSSTSATSVTVGSKPLSIVISDSGLYAFVANSGDSTVSAITLATLAVTSLSAGLAGSAPAAVSAASTTAGETLAVLDSSSKTLYFINIPSAGPGSASSAISLTGFAYPPIDIILSPAGRWAYVLEQDSAAAKTGYVQVADVRAVFAAATNILGAPVSVGIQPTSEILSADGSHLYVSYGGDGKSIPGGIAILNVVQDGCCDIFKQTIEGCPDCTDGNCIVLATINSYKYEQPVGLADIDNLTDRHLLVSTDLLTQAVQCLCEQGGGGTGKSGQDGAQGPPGPGIDLVKATFVPCDQPGSATITGTSPNRTLNLVIPGDCNKDLVGVANVSWAPQPPATAAVLGKANLAQLIKPGLRIAFTGSVQATDLANPADSTSNTVILLAPVVVQSVPAAPSDLIAYCEVPIRVKPVLFSTPGDITSTPGPVVGGLANGVVFSLFNTKDEEILFLSVRTKKPLRVLVKGDFIRDSTAKQRGLDGNHLPPWVPTRPSGDGIEGGTFESWFTLDQQG